MLKEIQTCFRSEKFFFTKHARDEMEEEKFGEIREREVFEAVESGKVIETYPKDEPYPSCLIYGRTFPCSVCLCKRRGNGYNYNDLPP